MELFKRIAALAGVILLLALYIATFVFAMLGNEWLPMLKVSIIASAIVPVFMWIVSYIAKLIKKYYSPEDKGLFGMYISGKWYKLRAHHDLKSDDPVKGLDVSVLQDGLLGPVLGIGDPRTDKRIDFVGGIRGLGELERRCSEDMTVAFSMHPTSIEELFEVADAGLLMPPKSTECNVLFPALVLPMKDTV